MEMAVFHVRTDDQAAHLAHLNQILESQAEDGMRLVQVVPQLGPMGQHVEDGEGIHQPVVTIALWLFFEKG